MKKTNRKIQSFFILIFFLFNLFELKSQAYIPNSRLIPIDTLAANIEKKFHVKLYYKPEWFVNKSFRESLLTLPFNENIETIDRIANISHISFNNSTVFVFVPFEMKNYSERMNNNGVIIIGEPNNNANANIYGKIIDFKTGKPLDAARITIDKLNLNATTDRSGNFKFVVPKGEYDLRINYVGYDEDYKKINVIGDGIVNFEISEKVIRLKEILVTDRLANLNLISSQMSAVKFNSKVIKELPGFLGEKDVIKGVTLLPGVQSTGEFGTGFFVRGGSADQNLILVEDVPIFNSSHLFGLSSAVNSDAISSVSLLKAGIPSKYGERASSVMDIQMKSHADKFAVKGGIGLLDSRLNVEIPMFNKNVSLFVGGRTSYSDWLLHAMPDVDLKNSSASFYDINALLNIRLTDKDHLSFFAYTSNDKFSFVKGSPYQYDNLLASVKYHHNFNSKFSSYFMTGLSGYRNNVTSYDTLSEKTAYKISSEIQYKNSKLNFNWTPNKKHNIDFGLNGVLYNLQPGKMLPYGSLSEVAPEYTTKQHGMELAAYIGDNITFSPAFSTEIGVRFNHYDFMGAGKSYVFEENAAKTTDNIIDTLYYNNGQIIKSYINIEPRLSVRYSLEENSSVKLSYNKISQAVNLVSNTVVMSPTDVYHLSDINTKPLINQQIGLGYFRNFKNNSIESSVELYYKKSDNILEYRNGAQLILNDALDADLLNASGYSYGAEFYVKKNSGNLTGWLSYTYSRALRHTTSPYTEDQINNNKYYSSPYDIPHNLVVNANYHLTKRWMVSGVFYYSTGKPITLPELKYDYNGFQYIYYSDRNKYRLPDYNRFDLSITFDESLRIKQKWKGSWTLSILNVYGQKNPYSVFYKSDSSTLKSIYYQSFNLYKMYIINRPIPTFTYNFSF